MAGSHVTTGPARRRGRAPARRRRGRRAGAPGALARDRTLRRRRRRPARARPQLWSYRRAPRVEAVDLVEGAGDEEIAARAPPDLSAGRARDGPGTHEGDDVGRRAAVLDDDGGDAGSHIAPRRAHAALDLGDHD